MHSSLPGSLRLALSSGFSLLALALLFGGGGCNTAELRASAPQQRRVCGRMLYRQNCLPCHGATGLGDGPGAALLDPRPRDFSLGTFRLVSTENGVPSDEDLYDVITHGIVGSAMPPHDNLSERERRALVGFVRSLIRSRRADVLQAAAEARGEPIPRPEALQAATVTPGAVVELPVLDPMPGATQLLAEGRQLFVASCSACHGLDGAGGTRTDMLDDKGLPVFPRDFTAGVLKGGSNLEDIHRRIRCGMPGSPMPATELPPREALALATYVHSLIPPGAQEQLAQVHMRFTPQRVDGPLDTNPQAPVWDTVDPRWVPLAPLQWTEHRVPGVQVQMARDDHSLAVRLVWEDTSGPDSALNLSPDTAALRFSPAAQPQFFCPGRTGQTQEAWTWDAELGDEQDITRGPAVHIRARHHQGYREVVFLRDLSLLPERVGMSPDGASVAFEIRNGADGDPDRSQNITVWHRLEVHGGDDDVAAGVTGEGSAENTSEGAGRRTRTRARLGKHGMGGEPAEM